MRVRCSHGFFIVDEVKIGQISDYITLTGLQFARWRDAYTFTDLVDAPDYSVLGKTILGNVAIQTIEGDPWEVFEANRLVYNFSTGLVVPIDSITQQVTIRLAGNRYVSTGLILPGSLTDEGLRVTDYSAWFSRDTQRWLYSEVITSV